MSPLSKQDVLDEAAKELVRQEQVEARDEAGDEDDRGALDQLLLARPVDLLELAPRLGDEAPDAPARGTAALTRRLRGLGRRRTGRRLALRRALDGGATFGLRCAAGAALGAGLPGH